MKTKLAEQNKFSPLQKCEVNSGYMLTKWANQHGSGVKARFISSSLHDRINRRVGLTKGGFVCKLGVGYCWR